MHPDSANVRRTDKCGRAQNIANVIETYGIPGVSITDSHRLKLSGISTNDLASIRKALNMPVFSPAPLDDSNQSMYVRTASLLSRAGKQD